MKKKRSIPSTARDFATRNQVKVRGLFAAGNLKRGWFYSGVRGGKNGGSPRNDGVNHERRLVMTYR